MALLERLCPTRSRIVGEMFNRHDKIEQHQTHHAIDLYQLRFAGAGSPFALRVDGSDVDGLCRPIADGLAVL